MTKYIVDIKVKANLRTFIEHDSPKQAIESVKEEMMPTLPEELGDFEFSVIEVTETNAEESWDED